PMGHRMGARQRGRAPERGLARRGQVLVPAYAAEQPPGIGVLRLAVAGRLRRFQRVMDPAVLEELARALEKLQCGRYSNGRREMRLFRPVPRVSLAQRTDAAGLSDLYRMAWAP